MGKRAKWVGIAHAVRVTIFPRGLRRLCKRRGFEDRLDAFCEHLKDHIRHICRSDAVEEPAEEPSTSPYYCEWVPAPEAGENCVKEVCYNDEGLVISEGQAVCAGPQGGEEPEGG